MGVAQASEAPWWTLRGVLGYPVRSLLVCGCPSLGGAWQLLGQYLLRLVIPRGDFSETFGPLSW